MDTHNERIIADRGGVVIAERGPLIIVIDRGTGPIASLAFVLGVVALIFGGFGAVTLAFAAFGREDVPAGVAAGFLVVGIAVAVATLAMYRGIRGQRDRPLDSYCPTGVFDRARRVFLDGSGTVVAPLDHVRFRRRMQIGSSSPKLVAVTPHGDRLLKRGNPFDGGIGNLDKVLAEVVHGR
jgi:hypothetical protein